MTDTTQPGADNALDDADGTPHAFREFWERWNKDGKAERETPWRNSLDGWQAGQAWLAAHLASCNAWISVDDRLPQPDADVLVRYVDSFGASSESFAVAYLRNHDGWLSWDTSCAQGHEWEPAFSTDLAAKHDRITHWISLQAVLALIALARRAAQPVVAPSTGQAEVIEMLLEVVMLANDAMENTEENEHGHVWSRRDFDALSDSMDKLDALPDDQPGYVMGPAAKARWAMRATHPSEPAVPAVGGDLNQIGAKMPCGAVVTNVYEAYEAGKRASGGGALVAMPERDQSKPAEQQGLFHKFDIRRVDGSDQPGGKHYGCRYYVLDLTHDQHAPAAMRAYAASCRVTHPKLADDIEAEFGAAPAGALVAKIEYVPMAMSASDKAQGWHANDKTPNDPACQKALDARGDDRGQGLDPYWKWGFRAGWQDATGSAAAPADIRAALELAIENMEQVGLHVHQVDDDLNRRAKSAIEALLATSQPIPTGEKA